MKELLFFSVTEKDSLNSSRSDPGRRGKINFPLVLQKVLWRPLKHHKEVCSLFKLILFLPPGSFLLIFPEQLPQALVSCQLCMNKLFAKIEIDNS